MSYDIYFWWRAVGHPDDVADDLANEDATAITRHESVRAFRGTLIASYPDLQDCVEPAEDDLHDAYLILTLPLHRAAVADEAIALARTAGVQAYDPQRGHGGSVPVAEAGPTLPRRPHAAGVVEEWSREEIAAAAELGPRRLKRAWDFLDLPRTVPFGDALTAVVFALALSDGADVTREQALLTARSIAGAAPRRGVNVTGSAHIDFVVVDLESYARALSRTLP